MSAECGTYAGYQQHGKRGEERCPACRKANAEYRTRWRKERPRTQAAFASQQMARDRALRQLARLFPAELRVLYEAELAKLPDPFPATTAARAEREAS